jgi:hypothetical protein
MKIIVLSGYINEKIDAFQRANKVIQLYDNNTKVTSLRFDEIQYHPEHDDYAVKEEQIVVKDGKETHKELVLEASEKKLIEAIKAHVLATLNQEKADVVLVDTHHDLENSKNRIVFKAMLALEKELGDEEVIFIHINGVPHLHGTPIHEYKEKSMNIIKATGIKPRLVIEGHEITWLR